jgi:hypothetical protein
MSSRKRNIILMVTVLMISININCFQVLKPENALMKSLKQHFGALNSSFVKVLSHE